MIERIGMQPVPEVEKTRSAMDLFWIWFAANIGILSILFGVVIVSFHLGFAATILTAVIGSLSFIIVGVLSVAGRDAGQPMIALSAKVFGHKGNFLLAFINWINLLGWEAVMVLTSTFTLQAILAPYAHSASQQALLYGSVVVFLLLFLVLGLYGFHIVLFVQKFVVAVFGILTLVVLAMLLREGSWQGVVHAQTGGGWEGFLAALSLILASTSISWAMASSDYSRYLSRQVKTRSILLAVTLGSGIPLFVLLLTGILLAGRMPQLATASNPIQALSSLLPTWMAIPYLLAVVGGLLAEAVLGFYSSGFNLMAMGVRVSRPRTAWIDFAVSLLAVIYGLSHPQDFFGTLEGFLSLMGVGLAAWAGIFMADEWWIHSRRKETTSNFRVLALSSWAVTTVLGVLFTATPLYAGPFAEGIFSQSNLGMLLAFLMSGTIYALLEKTLPYVFKKRVI